MLRKSAGLPAPLRLRTNQPLKAKASEPLSSLKHVLCDVTDSAACPLCNIHPYTARGMMTRELLVVFLASTGGGGGA
jgi:hypothetical protein